MFPVPGNGSYDWLGFIPFEELPYLHEIHDYNISLTILKYTKNPAKGYISSANNKVVPDSYPYLLLNDHDWEVPLHHYFLLLNLIHYWFSHTLEPLE